jgi:hypothetical protein
MPGLKKHQSSEATAANSSQVALRPPALVMSPARAGAAYPNALCFSRSFVRKMQRERWRFETVRLELDGEGRGEGLYRVLAPGGTFHFFAVSNFFPPDQKVDRSFGINWDVSAAICQGAWTAEREAVLRQEIPKQYDGRYDNDVLCFCRGNRSERLFDHVVDGLTAGSQPDAELLATVGYILRSTAFAGNGLFGMRPFEGLDPEHPLAATYHVQMLAAFLLREFVFDLVDAMAAARSPSAAKLDLRLKRYLGVGNSAGLGLIPFVANHPQIVHQWCLVNEQAFADAKARLAAPGSETSRTLLGLLERTIRYFKQDPRDGNGIFASYELLAGQFAEIVDHVAGHIGANAKGPTRPWAVLADWVAERFHPEAAEIFNGLLLELYPDIVAAHDTKLTIVEQMDVQPDMSVAVLKSKLRSAYDWLLSSDGRIAKDTAFFWYYPVEAPYEPRRGLRGRAPDYEFESNMDMPLKLPELVRILEGEPDDASVASLLARHPELRATVTRVQSVADMPYAELRENFLATSCTPFATCRFLLAFYGMEKYDPRPPRSTKGALLQGAPVAAEIEAQIEGEWPFPLAPDLGMAGAQTAPKLPPLRVIEAQETSVRRIQELAATAEAKSPQRRDITIFPLELRKLLTKALLASGHGLGDAEFIAELAQLSETLRQNELDLLLDCLLGDPRARAGAARADGATIDAGGGPAFAGAAAALDLACADAARHRAGAAVIRNTGPSPLLLALPARAAERGFIAVLADLAQGVVSLAGPGAAGPWWIKVAQCRPRWAADLAARSDGRPLLRSMIEDLDATKVERLLASHAADATPTEATSACVLLCLSPRAVGGGADAAFAACAGRGKPSWSPAELKRARESVDRNGFSMPGRRFDRLSALAKRALIPEAAERLIVPSQ